MLYLGKAKTQNLLNGFAKIRPLIQEEPKDNLLCWVEDHNGPHLYISSSHPHECPELLPLYAAALRVNTTMKEIDIAKDLGRHTEIRFRYQCVPMILSMAKRHGHAIEAPARHSSDEDKYQWTSFDRDPREGRRYVGLSEDELQGLEVDSPEMARLVLARGEAQAKFRSSLMIAYGAKCAVCGLDRKEALEAAHIYRWSEADEYSRKDPQNGLLLCANHHGLFDANQLRLTTSLEYFDVITQEGGSLQKPYPPTWQPDPWYIEQRYKDLEE